MEHPGITGAEGYLIRDANGNWIVRFSINIGTIYANVVDELGLFFGLALAKTIPWFC